MKTIFIILSFLILSGCAGQKQIMPAPYTIVINSDENLNPDRNGNASPVLMRIYRLKNLTVFNNSDFFSMHEDDDNVLAADIVSKDSFMLQPGEKKEIKGKATISERYLGIFVAYRDINNAVWRGSSSLPAPKELGRFLIFNPKFESTLISINVGPNKISLTSDVKSEEKPKDN